MFDISSTESSHTGAGRLSALLEGWMPPSRENWELIVTIWQWAFPIVRITPRPLIGHCSLTLLLQLASLQWLVKWYGMGKTSVASRLNLPGRIAWLTMEAPGFLTLSYIMRTLPARQGIDDLPWQNKVLAGLFVIHYLYRAVAFPLLAPSMSPMHVLIWASALGFQLVNGTCLGAWLAAYGPVTESAWEESVPLAQFVVGICVCYVGLSANFFHDEELRDIRWRERRRQEKLQQQQGGRKGTVDKHYRIPQAGLFRYVLYPHYLCEWIEWTGFWMAAGWGSAPARAFLVNEVVAMLPRAVRGREWYRQTFGDDKIRGKYAVIPGLI